MPDYATLARNGEIWSVTPKGKSQAVASFNSRDAAVTWAFTNGFVISDDDQPPADETAPESLNAYYWRCFKWALIGVPVFWLLWGLVNAKSP